MAGFILSHRKLWENPIFKGNAMRVGVWDWMLKMAAWQDTTQIVGSEVVTVKRGQLCVSQSQITDATGMPRQPLRTFLNLLEKTNTIATQPATNSTKGRTLITICKYEEYQAPKTDANQTPTKHQPNTNQLKKQGNKVTIEEPKGSLSPPARKTASGTRLPEDWFLPAKWGDWALEQGLDHDLIRLEADKFRDYYVGLAGAKARKAEWEATWRNWIRGAIERKSKFKAFNGDRYERPDHQKRPDPALEQIARIARTR